jgi:hypothetical protein
MIERTPEGFFKNTSKPNGDEKHDGNGQEKGQVHDEPEHKES